MNVWMSFKMKKVVEKKKEKRENYSIVSNHCLLSPCVTLNHQLKVRIKLLQLAPKLFLTAFERTSDDFGSTFWCICEVADIRSANPESKYVPRPESLGSHRAELLI